jgi:hypothetical protein
MSTDDALPLDGAVPPCHRVVTPEVVPSTCTELLKKADPPLVFKNATVMESPIAIKVFNVVPELPRMLIPKLAEAFVV